MLVDYTFSFLEQPAVKASQWELIKMTSASVALDNLDDTFYLNARIYTGLSRTY